MPNTLNDLEHTIASAASVSNTHEQTKIIRPWETEEIQELKHKRSQARDKDVRRSISLRVRKLLRKAKHEYQDRYFENILHEVKNLNRFEIIQQMPIKRRVEQDKPVNEEVHQF